MATCLKNSKLRSNMQVWIDFQSTVFSLQLAIFSLQSAIFSWQLNLLRFCLVKLCVLRAFVVKKQNQRKINIIKAYFELRFYTNG
jgi:hypothetical protein